MSTDVYIDIFTLVEPFDVYQTPLEIIRIGHVYTLSYEGWMGINVLEWLRILCAAIPMVTEHVLVVVGSVLALKERCHKEMMKVEDLDFIVQFVQPPDWTDMAGQELVDELRPHLGLKWSIRVD